MNVDPLEPAYLSSHSLVDPPRSGRPSRKKDDLQAARSSSFREVVACVDGSDLGQSVIPHARVVAGAFGARLTLVHVLEPPPTAGGAPPDPLGWGIRQREAQAHLDALARKASEPGSEIRTELIQGRPAEQLCAWVEHHDADLTVLCSHGERGLTGWGLASNARKLIERIPSSLLLVPAAVATKREEPHYRRILVPLDGSAQAECALPIAMRIAAAQQAELLFVHIVPTPEITRLGPFEAEGAVFERRVIEHNRRAADAYLDRLHARASQAGSRVRALVVGDGATQSHLLRMIREESVDLVVMSDHGHSGRTDSPCGSVTEHALTHATVPLLVVRDRALRQMRRADPSPAGSGEPLPPSGHASM